MSPIVFFIMVIPILSFVLLLINFIFAPHNPYKEKKTPFECGYHSFLAQNRTQFTISFFIFGLLFLLFDLEIIMIYPLTVSSYINEGYGFIIMILFVLVLALGFIFELGKKALKIDSKQDSGSLPNVPLKSHNFINSSLQSNIFSFILFRIFAILVNIIKSRISNSVSMWLKWQTVYPISTHIKNIFGDISIIDFFRLVYVFGVINVFNFIVVCMYLVVRNFYKHIFGTVLLIALLSLSVSADHNVSLIYFLPKVFLFIVVLDIHANYIIPRYYYGASNIWYGIVIISSFLLMSCCLFSILSDIVHVLEYVAKQISELTLGPILKMEENSPGHGSGEPSGSGRPGSPKGPRPDYPFPSGHGKRKREQSDSEQDQEYEYENYTTYDESGFDLNYKLAVLQLTREQCGITNWESNYKKEQSMHEQDSATNRDYNCEQVGSQTGTNTVDQADHNMEDQAFHSMEDQAYYDMEDQTYHSMGDQADYNMEDQVDHNMEDQSNHSMEEVTEQRVMTVSPNHLKELEAENRLIEESLDKQQTLDDDPDYDRSETNKNKRQKRN